jgi:hypothetical protein
MKVLTTSMMRKVLFLAVLGLATLQVAASAQQSSGGGRLAGTWDALVTIRNCATGDAITSFLSTANFNQGGTYSGITSGSSPTVRTSERGIWEHVNGNIYRFRFRAYLYNPAAVAVAYQIVTHDVELDESNMNYTSSGTSDVFDMSGNPISSGCSTTVGSRMTLEQ